MRAPSRHSKYDALYDTIDDPKRQLSGDAPTASPR
jgi:hypothetical protein